MRTIQGAHAAYRHLGEPGSPVFFVDHVSPRTCGLLRNSAWPAKGQQPVTVMTSAVLGFLATSPESLSPERLQGLLHRVEAALQPLAGPSKSFPDEDLWDLGGSLALISPLEQQVIVLRVGDFRIVRIRDRQLDVLAREHTLRAQLETRGQVLAGNSGTSFGNVIVAYLGGGLQPPPDAITGVEVKVGDRIAIFENPTARSGEEDLALLESVRILSAEEAAPKVLDALVERARVRAERPGRAVGIVDVVA
jgi:hypothetical protein